MDFLKREIFIHSVFSKRGFEITGLKWPLGLSIIQNVTPFAHNTCAAQYLARVAMQLFLALPSVLLAACISADK